MRSVRVPATAGYCRGGGGGGELVRGSGLVRGGGGGGMDVVAFGW